MLASGHGAGFIPETPVDNWIVILLIGIILSSTICIVDYFFSTKTFDKLKRQYARGNFSNGGRP